MEPNKARSAGYIDLNINANKGIPESKYSRKKTIQPMFSSRSVAGAGVTSQSYIAAYHQLIKCRNLDHSASNTASAEQPQKYVAVHQPAIHQSTALTGPQPGEVIGFSPEQMAIFNQLQSAMVHSQFTRIELLRPQLNDLLMSSIREATTANDFSYLEFLITVPGIQETQIFQKLLANGSLLLMKAIEHNKHTVVTWMLSQKNIGCLLKSDPNDERQYLEKACEQSDFALFKKLLTLQCRFHPGETLGQTIYGAIKMILSGKGDLNLWRFVDYFLDKFCVSVEFISATADALKMCLLNDNITHIDYQHIRLFRMVIVSAFQQAVTGDFVLMEKLMASLPPGERCTTDISQYLEFDLRVQAARAAASHGKLNLVPWLLQSPGVADRIAREDANREPEHRPADLSAATSQAQSAALLQSTQLPLGTDGNMRKGPDFTKDYALWRQQTGVALPQSLPAMRKQVLQGAEGGKHAVIAGAGNLLLEAVSDQAIPRYKNLTYLVLPYGKEDVLESTCRQFVRMPGAYLVRAHSSGHSFSATPLVVGQKPLDGSSTLVIRGLNGDKLAQAKDDELITLSCRISDFLDDWLRDNNCPDGECPDIILGDYASSNQKNVASTLILAQSLIYSMSLEHGRGSDIHVMTSTAEIVTGEDGNMISVQYCEQPGTRKVVSWAGDSKWLDPQYAAKHQLQGITIQNYNPGMLQRLSYDPEHDQQPVPQTMHEGQPEGMIIMPESSGEPR